MKRNITKGLGAFTPATWNQIRQSVEASTLKEWQGRDRRIVPIIYAKITVATQVAVVVNSVSTNRGRWKYEWVQVVRKASTSAFADEMFDPLVGGRNSNDPTGGNAKRYAVNLAEVGNTQILAFGLVVTNGINITNAVGFQLKPIPVNTIVELRMSRDRGGEISPTFLLTNPIDGGCALELTSIIDGGSF